MTKQSKELTKFYRAYLDWLEKGAPHGNPFYRDCGLCTNLSSYESDNNTSVGRHSAPYKEMKAQFWAEKLNGKIEDELYPFGFGEFRKGVMEKCMHENAARIQWVKDHANG